MKIKELISQLQKFDKNLDVRLELRDFKDNQNDIDCVIPCFGEDGILDGKYTYVIIKRKFDINKTQFIKNMYND